MRNLKYSAKSVIPDIINDHPDAVDVSSNVSEVLWSKIEQCSMSLSYLQRRLKQNEEDFARISGIDLDNNIKDVEKK